jgi:hypothetical protein
MPGCYACQKTPHAVYTCTQCETLYRHGVIGAMEVSATYACSFHEPAIDVVLRKHLIQKHQGTDADDLGKSFQRSKP